MLSGCLAALYAAFLAVAPSPDAAKTVSRPLSADIKKTLGMAADQPETWLVVYEGQGASEKARRRDGYDPTKDVLRVEFMHVAGDRYAWRTTLAAAPKLEDTVHHIYVDADDDPNTGRERYGVESMLTVAGGYGRGSRFEKDGAAGQAPPVRFAVDGNTLLTSADVELGRDVQGARFRMWVLCHTATTADQPGSRMSSTTNRLLVEGVPLNAREKIMLPADYPEHHRVAGTFGLDVIRPLLTDPKVVAVCYDQLEVDGFEVDLFTSQRYGHLKRLGTGARAWHKVAEPGRFFVGFLMYDDGSDQRIAIHVNDELAGVAVVKAGIRRHGIYYLDAPRDLKAGDVVTLEALGSGGKHGIAYLLLMPEAPAPRHVEYRVENTRWIAPVNTEGEAWISWTTTWPSDSRFEYGPTEKLGEAATEDCTRLVHRARLRGLQPGATYFGRGVGAAPDGSLYYGPTIEFTADGITPPPTREGVTRVPLTVRNWHGVAAAGWPVTGGVPFPQAALASDRDVRLMRDGKEVLAQFKPLGAWPDGSIKWLLVSLLVDADAGADAPYVLEFGRDVRRSSDAADLAPLAVEKDGSVQIDTGSLQLQIDAHGQLVGPDGPFVTELVDGAGKQFNSTLADADTTIEENGPVRLVVKTTGNLKADDGATSFRIEQRVEAWRGRPFVRVYHTFINTLPDDLSATTLKTSQSRQFSDVKRLSFVVPASEAAWRAPLVEGEPLTLKAGERVWQRFDNEFTPTGGEPAKGRIVGGLLVEGEAAAEGGTAAVSVRDFWQNYPKGFEVTAAGVQVDLCPAFEAGLYDVFPFEKEGHQLYYYLRDGTYTIKRGMAKTHELLLDFGAGAAERAALFQRPLLLTAEPAWYCGSKAFYQVAPRDTERFPAYEAAIDRNLQAYVDRRERQRDYGMMNYGDWYGERGANWGNIEYDTQHAFFLEYIRSANPDAFFLAEAAQVHNRDIDTVHWSPNPGEIGLVYIHQMGHVGGYYDESVPNTLGIPRAGGSVSHAWTEGQFDHYFLTGDPRSLETGMAVVDYFTNAELSRPYDWTSARVPGWHLIMLASALAATNDPYYLNASRIVVDRVLETQDTEPRELPEYQKRPGRTHQLGGWTRMMVPGHCHCEPRHRGNTGFMVTILLTGMTYYHDVTQEPAVKDAIILGARYLIDEFYSTETHGFRYTSCPEMGYRAGMSPMYAEGIARAYRWTGDEVFLDSLTLGLSAGARGANYGKGFSQYYRCAPRLLSDLAEVGLTLEEKPEK
ncbi:MAG: hypothetical protein U1E05_14025 [Patescibacteria group bacterium]|nr:hypothetical protein [Patescibacteria group bacterium]